MLRVGLGARTVAACWMSRDSGEWEEGRFEHARAQEHVCSGRGGGTPPRGPLLHTPSQKPLAEHPHRLPPPPPAASYCQINFFAFKRN